jgi:hypothetical protein
MSLFSHKIFKIYILVFLVMIHITIAQRNLPISGQWQFLYAFAKLQKAIFEFVIFGRPSVRPSFRLSVCLSTWSNSAPTGRILMKLDILVFFFENRSTNFKFPENPTRVTGTSHEVVFTFMTISRWILLRMRNVSNKTCKETQNTHFKFNNASSANRTLYEKYQRKWWSQRGCR